MSAQLRAKPCTTARARRCGAQRLAVVASSQVRPHTLGSVAAAAVAAGVLLSSQGAAYAVGIESVDFFPTSIDTPAMLSRGADEQRQKLSQVDEAFQNSDTLKELLARSEANKAKNKKDIANKYCYRQAELGVGDCGGLRYIPGLTENGKQKTPQWLADLLGVDVTKSADPSGGKTLKDLIYDDKK